MLEMLNLRIKRGGTSICVCKQYRLTKASYKLSKYELKKSKTVVLYDVCAHMDPCAYLPKWFHLEHSSCFYTFEWGH